MKKRSLLLISCILLVLIIVIYSYLNNNNYYYKVDSRIDSVKNMNKEYKEVTSWLKVQGTNIDYPVINTQLSASKTDTDIKYDYLWTNINSSSLNNRTIIYGHNIKNVSNKPLIKDKTHKRFEQLMAFVYIDEVKQNKYIQYTINNTDYLYKIFSVSFINEKLDPALNIDNNIELNDYIKTSLQDSIYDFDIDVNNKDKIISLFTCTRYFGVENSDIKFRVDARLVRKNEKIKNYKVEKNKNYKKTLEGETI